MEYKSPYSNTFVINKTDLISDSIENHWYAEFTFGRKPDVTDKRYTLTLQIRNSQGMNSPVVGTFVLSKFGKDDDVLIFKIKSKGYLHGKSKHFMKDKNVKNKIGKLIIRCLENIEKVNRD